MSSVALQEWVALNSIPGMGARTFLLLLQRFGSPETALQAQDKELASVAGIPARTLAAVTGHRTDALRAAEKELEEAEKSGVSILTLWDADYPPALRQIYDPPPVLYVKGDLTPADEHAIALVGTRRASDYGRSVAERFATDLAKLSFTVVSGLARGIDAAAHTAALRAKGRTIAVLGSGILRIYPPEHRPLAEKIAASGAVVSEFPLRMEPHRSNFPIRNRIISALSRAVVVVEGEEGSGSMITADCALEQGRDVFAVPGNILRPGSRGPHKLLKAGCHMAEDVRDVLEATGYLAARRTVPKAEEETHAPIPREVMLDEEERKVFRHLGELPAHIDDLSHAAGVPVSRLARVLTMLEIKGIAKQEAGMRFVRTLA